MAILACFKNDNFGGNPLSFIIIYNGLGLNFKEVSRKLIINFKELCGDPLSIILFKTCDDYSGFSKYILTHFLFEMYIPNILGQCIRFHYLCFVWILKEINFLIWNNFNGFLRNIKNLALWQILDWLFSTLKVSYP